MDERGVQSAVVQQPLPRDRHPDGRERLVEGRRDDRSEQSVGRRDPRRSASMELVRLRPPGDSDGQGDAGHLVGMGVRPGRSGRECVGPVSLVTGWYRYPVDLNTPLDVSKVNYVEVAFAGAAGTAGTVYIDDIVLFNSTAFAETARVAQTFTKSTPTGASPNSLRLVFDLEATSSSSVVANLEVAIGSIVEWSETPVAAGTRTVEVDLSGDAALQATGSFNLVISLRLNRTGWEEPSMMAWIDNVTLVIPGTLARIAVTPTTASVLVGQTTVFTAGGWDTDGNPVPLTGTNWSSTIGQIVAVNSTSARFEAPTQP